MRVFNKEVTMCARCPHINQPDNGYHSESCNYDYLVDIKDPHVIAKNCPFNKPITKEVIEGFGFVQNHTNTAKMYSIFKDTYSVFLYKDDKNYFEISNCHDTLKIHGSAVEWLFRGIINNPVELEFILRSTGVIE